MVENLGQKEECDDAEGIDTHLHYIPESRVPIRVEWLIPMGCPRSFTWVGAHAHK